MSVYYTKCGKYTFKKPTNASVTRYEELCEDCEGCHFIEEKNTYRGGVQVPIRFCQAGSKPPLYRNDFSTTNLQDSTTLSIISLDYDFLNKVHEFACGLNGCTNQRKFWEDGPFHGVDQNDCRKSMPLYFEQNKSGKAAKKNIIETFFGAGDKKQKIRSEKKYLDNKGQIVFVRAGIGQDCFKPFYKVPGKGEHGMKQFEWRKSQNEAQEDLDLYAIQKKWLCINENEADSDPRTRDENKKEVQCPCFKEINDRGSSLLATPIIKCFSSRYPQITKEAGFHGSTIDRDNHYKDICSKDVYCECEWYIEIQGDEKRVDDGEVVCDKQGCAFNGCDGFCKIENIAESAPHILKDFGPKVLETCKRPAVFLEELKKIKCQYFNGIKRNIGDGRYFRGCSIIPDYLPDNHFIYDDRKKAAEMSEGCCSGDFSWCEYHQRKQLTSKYKCKDCNKLGEKKDNLYVCNRIYKSGKPGTTNLEITACIYFENNVVDRFKGDDYYSSPEMNYSCIHEHCEKNQNNSCSIDTKEILTWVNLSELEVAVEYNDCPRSEVQDQYKSQKEARHQENSRVYQSKICYEENHNGCPCYGIGNCGAKEFSNDVFWSRYSGKTYDCNEFIKKMEAAEKERMIGDDTRVNSLLEIAGSSEMSITSDDDQIALDEKIETIKKRTGDILNNYIEIGFSLIDIRDQKLYKSRGYANLIDCVESELSIKKSTCYNLIKIAELFGDDGTRELKDEYRKYNYTQCLEMTTMSPDLLRKVNPEMSKREMHELKDQESNQLESNNVSLGRTVVDTENAIDVTEYTVVLESNQPERKDIQQIQQPTNYNNPPTSEMQQQHSPQTNDEVERANQRARDAERRAEQLEKSLKQSQDAHKSKNDLHRTEVAYLQKRIENLNDELQKMKNKKTSLDKYIAGHKEKVSSKKPDEDVIQYYKTQGYLECLNEFLAKK